MVSSKKRYRRVSVTQEDGKHQKYDARVDIEADPETGAVVYKVYSQVLPEKMAVYRCTGNAVEDAIGLEKLCQQMFYFDQGYRVRAVPKPAFTGQATAARVDVCPRCGGQGWVEDETGYPVVCACRGG